MAVNQLLTEFRRMCNESIKTDCPEVKKKMLELLAESQKEGTEWNNEFDNVARIDSCGVETEYIRLKSVCDLILKAIEQDVKVNGIIQPKSKQMKLRRSERIHARESRRLYHSERNKLSGT